MSAPSTTTPPEVLWAQRSSDDEPGKNVVMLTINVPNLPSNPTVELTSTGLKFQAKVGDKSKGIEDKEYKFECEFYEEIDVENSKQHLTSKSLYMVLRKKEAKLDYWPRLTKEKVRLHNVKTDFDKWVDEDEQGADLEDLTAGMGGGMGGMDPSMMGMGGAGGMDPSMMGGMGGMDLQQMMAQMGGGGMPDLGGEGEDSDGDDFPEDDEAAAKVTEAEPAKTDA